MNRVIGQFKKRQDNLKRILLVDDERDFGWIMKDIMYEAGHKLIYASSFKEGVRKLKRLRNLDMAIIDLRLEDGDGLNFIKKTRGLNNRVKFVMVSGFGSPDVKFEAGLLGVRHFLEKPFRIERLLNIINHDSNTGL